MATTLNSTQADAWAQLQQTLQQYGFTGASLTQLVAWAKNEVIAGNSSNQIMLDLEQTPQFAQRFPAIVQREQQGLPPISPADYISMEQSYEQLERAAGIPPNFASYDALIAADVSPTEYQARIQQGYQAVANADPTVIQAMQDYYGVSMGQLAAYFLDPTKAAPLLEQQAISAQIGGAAAMAQFSSPAAPTSKTAPSPVVAPLPTTTPTPGATPATAAQTSQAAQTYGGITQAQALRLAQMGVTQAQAQQGFQNLVTERQLYQGLPGQAEQYMTTDQLLNQQFGSDAMSKQTLQRQADVEKGMFNQGGKVAETTTGYTGAGTLQR